ncbi:Quinoprotein amine dehydrogenase [Hibiscus syriacus]|uniref:ferric-chelate reductase (NADH) n=1 Tax=Hibiscus syriacus TaxID=106335 RepID=A0A6A3A346_HIBSY|nr:Quinoprotein amine dehydrogenase [Hibiscus syriacus]
MMWIMAPTNTYKQKWKPAISEKVVSTYFGKQAPNMLVWTFPVLFVAALGSLYLHLGKKTPTKTCTVMKETVAGAMEEARFSERLPTLTAKVAAADGIKVWQLKLVESALWIGLTGNVCLAFLFYPVARGSSVLPVLGLTSEGSIKYHIWLGHLTMLLFTAHGVCFIVFWAAIGKISEMLKWSYSDISNVAGEISLIGGLGLWAATLPQIRRKFFELFFYTHHLYIIFVFFFVLHVGIGYTFIMLPGFYLFIIDRYLRFLQSRCSVRLLSARVLPCNVLELNFAKSHVSSNSNMEPDRLSVIIKSEGSWSTNLYRMLSSSIERLNVSIEGPYGPASNHFLRHDTVVMVSGGSGITPFISIIRELIFMSKLSQCKTPDIILIAIFKSSLDLTMLDLLLPMTGSPSELSNLKLRIEAYVTKEKEPVIDNSKRVRSIWFKPLPTDKPIAAILGPNSWLWLGAIISSSFIMFLILIGIITRCNGECSGFLEQRRYAREAMQVQNMEGQTPEGSPSIMAYNGERELESLPHQSLAEATKIHYGGRPDLKRLIFECKGESIGVLASGPTKLRHDVAAICSSGLVDNLHFESISFSW